MKRTLAVLIVLSVSVMSSAVGSCEVSCLLDDAHCVDQLGTASAAAQPATGSASMEMGGPPEHSRLAMGTGVDFDAAVGSAESVSCSNELCRDASASAMFPTARTDAPRAGWMAVGVVFPLSNWSSLECLGSKTESPPPKAVGLSPLSTILRI